MQSEEYNQEDDITARCHPLSTQSMHNLLDTFYDRLVRH